MFLAEIKIAAQKYPIDTYNGQTVSTCAGTFYDSGEDVAGYSNDEDYTITFQAPAASTYQIDFSELSIRTGDMLYAYDGPDTGSPLIGSYSGNIVGLSVASTSNYITFRFVSNSMFTRPGWAASISCNACSAPTAPVIAPNSSDECFGASVRYSVDFHAGSSYVWTVDQGSAVPVPGGGNEVDVTWNISGGVTGMVKVEETNSCGSSSTSEIFVDIYPLPAPVISGPDIVCPEAAGVIYSTPATAGSSFEWTLTGGATWTAAGASVTVNWPMTGPGSVRVKEIDGMGCSTSTPDYIVDIEDVTPPVISGCPAPVNLNVSPGTCANTATWIEPSANDNCSGALAYASRSHAPGSSFNTGVTTVTYTFTDAVGNTSTCSFDVTVTDNEDPFAVCKDITLTLDAGGNASITGADINGGSTDNCGIVSLIPSKTSFGTADIGINFVDLVAVDAAGNTSSCTAKVTVQNNTVPIAICKNISVFLGAGGTVTITGADIDNGSNDPDGIKSLVASPSVFDCSNIGVNNVTLTVTDNADRTSTCTSQVTVIDNFAPSISCPGNISVGSDAGICGAVVNYLTPVGTDNCSGSVTIQTAGLPAGSTFPVGTTTNTFRVADGSGNTATCSFTVTVTDNVKPVITLPAPPVVSAGAGCQAPVPVIAATVTDNCTASGSVVVTQSPVAGTMVPAGITVITVTAKDLAGNIQTSTINLMVVDASGPSITTPANVTQNLNASCQATVPDFLATLVVSDNCTPAGSITKTQTPAAGTVITGATSTNIVIQAADAAGNVSSVTVIFTTKDIIPPAVFCKNTTLNLNAAGNATLAPVDVIASASDNCGSLSYSLSKSSFTCADIGTQTVTLTATDGSLNSSSCNATVTVQDILPPVVNVKTFNLVINDITGTGTLLPSDVDFGSADNCGAVTLSVSPNTFDCTDLGTQTVTLTATDGHGNSASQNVDITVSTTLTVNSAGANSCNAVGPFSRFSADVFGGTAPYSYFWDCIEPVDMFVEINWLGWPIFTFTNTSNVEEPFFNNLVPDGLYHIQVTVTDTKGCSVVHNFTFNKTAGVVEDNLTENYSSACANEIKTYSVPAGATSYNWSIENGTIKAGAGTNSVTVQWGAISPGTLTAEITKPFSLIPAFSCTSYTIEHVTINPLPAPAFNAYPATACENSEYTYTLSGTFSTYAWSAVNGIITGGGTPSDNFVKVRWGSFANGSVSADVTNASGCHALATANVVINSLPAATLTSSQQPLNTFCSGTSVTFTASPGGSNYNFRVDGLSVQNGASNTFITSALTNGQTVDVIVTNASGCTATSSGITNTVVSFPVPSLASSQQPLNTFCAGTSVVFTAGGGTNFEFRVNGITVQNSGSPTYTTTSLTDGQTVDVIVSNAGGCSATSAGITNTIVAAPVPTLISSQQPLNTFCAGTSVTFTAGGGTSYNFRIDGVSVQNGASNTFTTTSLTNGQAVDVIVSNGTCSATSASITNTVNPLPSATLTSSGNPVCAGSNVTFTAGGGTSYNFRVNGVSVQNGASSAYSTSALTDGQYVDVIVSNAGGCSSTAAGITMSVVTPPVISITYAGSPYCSTTGSGQAVTLTGPSGGSYSAIPGGLSLNAGNGAIDPSSSTTGSYTVTYTYVVGAGCPDVKTTVPVVITPLPIAGFTYAGTPYCSTDTDPLPSFSGGGVAGIFSSLQPGLVFVSNATGQVDLSASAAGTYDIVNTIAAFAGCGVVTANNNITIATPPSATISYAGSPFCTSVTTAQAVTLTGSGAYAGGTYSYTGAGTLSINAATGSIIPSASTPGTYTVTYTIPAGPCSAAPATTSVIITAAKNATISYSGSPYCTSDGAGKPVTLTGDAGGTFSASPAGISIDPSTGSIVPALSAAGNYLITYTIPAGSGCGAVITTAPVTITALPTASISYPGAPYCSSAVGIRPVTLTGTGAYSGGTFAYTGTGTLTLNSSTGAVTPSTSTAGTYDITYTAPASAGCGPVTATTSVAITAAPSAIISYGGNPFCTTLTTAQPVTLTGTMGGTYSASPAGLSLNAMNGEIVPSTSTPATYTVTYSIPAAGGCSAFSTTTNVTITALPTVSISYAGSPFCTSIAPVTVTITGTGDYLGGNFISMAGLDIDAVTGVIYPATSTANTYVVTYDTGPSGGCASVLANTIVTINSVPTITSTTPGSRCGTGTVVLGATASSGTINWYANATGGPSLGTGTSFTTPAITNTTTYYVDATNLGCTTAARTAVTATVNAIPTLSITNPAAVCSPLTVDLTNAAVTAGSTPGLAYTYWTDAAGTIALAGETAVAASGTYYIRGTDPVTTCSLIKPVVVTINPLPAAAGAITGTTTVCQGQTAVAYSVPAIANATSYTWAYSGTGATITGTTNAVTIDFSATATNGNLTVTGINGCGSGTTSAVYPITVNPLPAAAGAITGTATVCQGQSAVAYSVPVIANATSYTWAYSGTGATITGTTNAVTIDFSVAATGGNLTVTGVNACGNGTTSAVYPIAVNSTPAPVIAGTLAACEGSTGNIYNVAAAAGHSYAWVVSGGTITAGSGTNQITVTWNTAGTGTVDVTETIDATGCNGAATQMSVVINALPAPVIAGSNAVCENSTGNNYSVALTAGHSYAWVVSGGTITAGSGTNQITVTWNTAGTGTVDVTETIDATGCSKAATQLSVGINSYPSPVITGPATACENSTGNIYSVMAAAGHSYVWAVTGGTITSGSGTDQVTVTWNSAGTGTVDVTETIDATGCSKAAVQKTVTVDPLPANAGTITGTATICQGQSGVAYSVPAIANAISYTWAYSGTGATITGTTNAITIDFAAAATSGDLTVTGVNACGNGVSSAAYTITVNPILPVSVSIAAGANPVCTGANITFTATPVNGGTTPSYQWYNGAAAVGTDSPTYSYLPANGDLITVVLTSSETCQSGGPATSNAVTVSVSTPVNVTSVNTDVLCNGASTGAIDISVTGGTAPYTFAWTGTGVSVASEDQTGLTAGTYIVTVTDANSCASAPVSVTLTEPAALTISIVSQANVTIYGGNDGSVEVAGLGGTGTYQYQLDAGAFQASGIFNSLSAGNYTVTVKDGNGCTKPVSVNITQPLASLSGSIVLQNNVTCFGTSTAMITVAGSGGTQPYEYSFDGGPWQSSGTFSNLAFGNYTVTVRDAVMSTFNVPVSITSPSAALALSVVSQTNISCFGANNGSATVSANGGIGPYQYSADGGSSQASGTFNLGPGTHTIVVVDVKSCTATVDVVISEPAAALSGSASAKTNVTCFGAGNGTVTITGAGGTAPYQYSLNSGTFQSSGTFQGLISGNYTVTIRDANMCTANVPVSITEPAAITLNTNHTDVLCPDDPEGTINLTISGGTQPYKIIWSDGATTLNRAGITDGDYGAVVTDQNGCAAAINLTVGVIGSEDCIEIPEIITPNGDGYNDTWRIKNIDMFPNAEVSVYTRWGKRVYESRNILAEPWDGTFGGKVLPTDSYHYILDLKNGSRPRSGVISIIK